MNKHQDNIPDGPTYSRTLGTRVNAGRPTIDFSEAIHSNQNLDHVPNGTRAAWDSTTQKAAAVDASGNLLFKNISSPGITTAAPTTTSTTYSVIPELTATITTKGNKVLAIVYCELSINANTQTAVLALFRDGVQVSGDVQFEELTSGAFLFVSFSFIDSPSAASHTYDVRWKLQNVGPTMTAIATVRGFQVVELG